MRGPWRTHATWSLGVGLILAANVAQAQEITPEPTTAADLLVSSEAADREAAQKRERAESLVARREAAMGRSLDPAYRSRLVEAVARQPLAELQKLEAGGEDAPLLPNALGDSSADLVYTPVTPCRVFDTRSSVNGILVGGTERSFEVAGSGFGFVDQGGNPNGCGIPFGPTTSVIINFAAVTPTGLGNLRAWAVASPQPPAPTASVMNFNPVLFALANGAAVPICDPFLTSCPRDLRLRADVSSVHVVGDVVGYFSRFPKEQVRPLSVSRRTTNAAPLGTSCGNYGGLSFTLSVPFGSSGGDVLAQASVMFLINHTAGTADDIGVFIETVTGPAGCRFSGGQAAAYVSAAEPSGTYYVQVPVVFHTFHSSSGPLTLYLNSFSFTGGGNDDFRLGILQATFFPF